MDKPIHNLPKSSYTKIKSIADLCHSSKRLKIQRHPSNETSNLSNLSNLSYLNHPLSDLSSNNTRVSHYANSEELALETAIL